MSEEVRKVLAPKEAALRELAKIEGLSDFQRGYARTLLEDGKIDPDLVISQAYTIASLVKWFKEKIVETRKPS